MNFSEVLKNLREKKGISIAQLSSLTGIEEKFLEALEKKEWDLLPPDIYIQGYLKKISQILEVDFKNLWELYRLEKRKLYLSGKEDFFPQLEKKKRFFGINFEKLIWSFLILLGLAYIGINLKPLFLPPKLEVISPAFDLVAFEDKIKVEGRTNAKSVFINGKEVPIEEGKFSYYFPLVPGLNILKIEAKNYFGRSTIVERKIIYQEK